VTNDIADLRLHVRFDEGSGPVIVLLHGINSDAECWRTVIDTIGPGYRVIAPDLLGMGLSPKPDDLDYSSDTHAAVLASTLDALGVTERFVLVGYSMGGNVAIRYAATHPERLRRLFLLSAPFYLPPEAYSRANFGWQYAQARFYQWLWRFVGRQKERDTLLYEMASGPLQGAMGSFLRTDDVASHWDRMQKNLTNTISSATFVDDLPKLTMPTVFALGIRDPIVRPDQTLALKRIKPSLEIRRIVGLSADHMLVSNAPETVAREILADEVRELRVRYRGGSGTPLVLLPGLGEDGRSWVPVAERLASGGSASGREVVVLDLLGFGGSPRPLSSHYTLEDHAAAVSGTLADLFGDTPVALAGQGFGATVALACAASSPGRVREVVAFAPALPDPDADGASRVSDPAVARLLATRDAYAELAHDERAQRLAGDKLEADVVPVLRSIDAVLATDAESLVARQKGPVRFVLPDGEPTTPRAWLVGRCASEPHLEAVPVEGGEQWPYRNPDAAVALITHVPSSSRDAEGPSSAGAESGLSGTGPTASGLEPMSSGTGLAASDVDLTPDESGLERLADRLLGRANAQLIRHGVLSLLGGLLLLLLPIPIPIQVVAWGFAVWLLVEAVQTIAGAVGLRRKGQGWIPWLLIGAVSLAFAVLVAMSDALALGILVWAVAGWALVRGASALFAAWKAPEVPGRRGLLVLQGLLAVVIGVLLLTVPEFGGRLLRWVLGGYLTASGVAALLVAYGAHRRTVRRVREYLEGKAG